MHSMTGRAGPMLVGQAKERHSVPRVQGWVQGWNAFSVPLTSQERQSKEQRRVLHLCNSHHSSIRCWVAELLVVRPNLRAR